MNVSELSAGVVDTSYSLGLPGSDLTKSPSGSEFLGDEEAASTCPLLTPSPPADIGYGQQLSVSSPEADLDPDITLDFEMADQNDVAGGENHSNFNNQAEVDATVSVQSVESSSSSGSASDPTACVQLLGNHHAYQQLNKTTEGAVQENGTSSVTFDQFTAGGEYCFTTWNWPLIRRSCSWVILSALMGAICIVVAMIINLPKVCEPEHTWWNTATVYEVFPASFQDSDSDGVGDLQGLSSRIGYLHSLGVGSVRLNSVFRSEHYPEGYEEPDSLVDIHPVLGTLEDMKYLIRTLHSINITLIMDIPVTSSNYNDSLGSAIQDPVYDSLLFWSSHKVDGFFLVGLDELTPDSHLLSRLASWRRAIGPGRLLVAPPTSSNVPDLVHVSLNMEKPLKPQLHMALAKWTKIMWSVGDSRIERLADRLSGTNNTIGALLLLMSLPGTPSLLYGDEIGLRGLHDPMKEREDQQHMRQLPPMAWSSKSFTAHDVLPWLPTAATLLDINYGHEALQTLAAMAYLRERSPQLYMISATKTDEEPNFSVRYSDKEGVIAMERWYPRRHVVVTLANLGPKEVNRDLSSLYYGGRVIVSYPSDKQGKYVTFRSLVLQPGETIVVELDK